MIGAGPLDGSRNPCPGDSGGPLFIPGDQARLIGDVSFGAGGCGVPLPVVYGEVYKAPMRTFVDSLVTRPANDDFPGLALSGAAGTTSANNTDAVGQTGEPAIAGSPADTSVWYSWTAPESGPTTFTTRDSGFDTTLGVFSSSVDGLTPIAANDDSHGAIESKVSFSATAGSDLCDRGRRGRSRARAVRAPLVAELPGHRQLQRLTGTPGSSSRIVPATHVPATGEPGEPSSMAARPPTTRSGFGGRPVRAARWWYTCGTSRTSSPGSQFFTGYCVLQTDADRRGGRVRVAGCARGHDVRIGIDGRFGTRAILTRVDSRHVHGVDATIVGTGGPITGTVGPD